MAKKEHILHTFVQCPGWGGEEAGRACQRPLHQHAAIFLCILFAHLWGELSLVVKTLSLFCSGKRERDRGWDGEAGQVHRHLWPLGRQLQHRLPRLHRLHLRHLQVCLNYFSFDLDLILHQEASRWSVGSWRWPSVRWKRKETIEKTLSLVLFLLPHIKAGQIKATLQPI